MGALTLKPNAFTHRPWERTTTPVRDPSGRLLRAALVGGRVVQLTGPGWLSDSVRFSYDGFRRQRLNRPHHAGRPVTWGWALAGWTARLYGANLRVCLGYAHRFVAPLVRAARLVGRPDGPPCTYVFDLNKVGSLFQGPFGVVAARHAWLALPARMESEEDGALPGPRGAPPVVGFAAAWVQLFGGRPRHVYGTCPGLWGAIDRPYRLTRPVYQVSPVVTLLGDALD